MKQSKRKTQTKLTQSQKKQPLNQQFQIDPEWTRAQISVVVQNEGKLTDVPKIVNGLSVYLFSDGSIVAGHLVEELRKLGLIKDQSALSYYLPDRGLFIFGLLIPKQGNPLPKQQSIEARFLQNKTLRLKVRERRRITIEQLIEQQKQKYEQVEQDKNPKGQKEKKISQVVEKVALWRKFYTGFYDQSGNYVQKQLDVAAQDVGIAKKTLDDYLLQIRNGKKYGFNFNEKFNSRIGELRAFVREEKRKQSGK